MKGFKRILVLGTLVLTTLFSGRAFPGPGEHEDRTLSPFFFVKSDNPQLDQLPLKSTSAKVNISGVMADVLVTQVYKNEGQKPLEAIYIFPASTRAAVYGLKMTIGKRVIEARIQKREEARRTYEQAREQGKTASLLEQQRPNVFQMNVANILPGDTIQVELNYAELLVPTDRVYEFVYPTVVGPRYSNRPSEAAPASEHWVKNPFLRQGENPPYAFDLAVTLAAGMPIADLACPSHKVESHFSSPSQAKVKLDRSENRGGNRDFILRYRLAGGQIQSGLLLSEGDKENFFLLMMQPPKRVVKEQLPGREYIFIVDVSGSMHGFPLDISKTLLKNLIGRLRPADRFNVLLFSGGSSVLSEQSLPAGQENIDRAIRLIDRQQGGGGTELLPALKRALSLEKPEGYSRTLVIATDGYVTVEEEVFDLIGKNIGQANLFAFGIGSSVNRHIIEGMAHVGLGEPFILTRPEEALSQAERFREMIQSPVLTRIKVDFNGFAVSEVEPAGVPDLFAERPIILFGKWRGQPQGKITLTGLSGEGPFREVIEVKGITPLKTNRALRYLWARHRITILSDFNQLRSDDRRIREITELGLTYNLLTAYTAFVAVDTEIRNQGGTATTVKQPLPLPQGVSDYAVGGNGKVAAFAPLRSSAQLAPAESAESSHLKKPLLKNEGKDKENGVTLEEVKVSGNLAKEEVLQAMGKRIREIRNCFPNGFPPEKIILKLTINPDGTVREVTFGSKITAGPRKCILEHTKKWHCPATRDGLQGEIVITVVPEP
jgi:Ca-activated chloride channel family protein